MTIDEFTRKNAIKLRSGIMPVKRKNVRLSSEYAFRYVNLRNYKEYIFIFLLNMIYTDADKRPESAVKFWEEDHNRNFLRLDDPEFETFLDKYYENYSSKRFHSVTYDIPDFLT